MALNGRFGTGFDALSGKKYQGRQMLTMLVLSTGSEAISPSLVFGLSALSIDIMRSIHEEYPPEPLDE